MSDWQADQPFDDLPLLPPPAELETTRVLKTCVEARAELAGLKRSADLIPNPGVLINTLPLFEAQTSSEIENIVTTADALFRQLQGGAAADPATREALRYRKALIEGCRSLGDHPVGLRTAERICTRIKGAEMTVRETGSVLANPATGEVTYTPPAPGPRLGELLTNWERFVHAGDPLDPARTPGSPG